MKNSMVETAVGAFVVAVALGFGGFMYSIGGLGGTTSGYAVQASFGSVDGINVGTDVRVAGIKVGTVTAQDLDRETYRANVKLSLDPSVKLPEDTTAKIASEGLLGGKFISLEPGGSETMIESGGDIEFTQDAIDIFGLVSQFVLGSNKSEDKKTEETPATTEEAPAATDQSSGTSQ
ncbi:MAG: outer membrane lipid asymmetry maintenance protein MlaD [Anderseniella sp.]